MRAVRFRLSRFPRLGQLHGMSPWLSPRCIPQHVRAVCFGLVPAIHGLCKLHRVRCRYVVGGRGRNVEQRLHGSEWGGAGGWGWGRLNPLPLRSPTPFPSSLLPSLNTFPSPRSCSAPTTRSRPPQALRLPPCASPVPLALSRRQPLATLRVCPALRRLLISTSAPCVLQVATLAAGARTATRLAWHAPPGLHPLRARSTQLLASPVHRVRPRTAAARAWHVPRAPTPRTHRRCSARPARWATCQPSWAPRQPPCAPRVLRGASQTRIPPRASSVRIATSASQVPTTPRLV